MCMPDLQFDDAQSFDQNLESFLAHMEVVDAEMGSILRTHIGELKNAFDDATRRDARTHFNEAVVTALDELVPNDEEETV